MNIDELYILRCLELARKGLGKTRQNPMVGSVIVYDDKIIGEGYHFKYGGSHAEVNAINSVRDKTVLSKSTLYVNLEPCSHFGKTPPCSFLIRDSKIPKVVIGSNDPNPEVSGKGIQNLRESGIEVITGVKERESRFLNRRFFTFYEKKRPYIILKWAQSKDGYIDKIRNPEQKANPTWISNPSARILVHKWRGEELAIMAGTNTILSDNPSLDVRDWPGENPVRIIPDKNGRLFERYKIFNAKSKTIIFTSTYTKSHAENIEYLFLPENRFSISVMIDELYKRNFLSILVEGGATLLNSFLESGIWDEARVFTGCIYFNEGLKAPVIKAKLNDNFNYRGNHFNLFINNHLSSL